MKRFLILAGLIISKLFYLNAQDTLPYRLTFSSSLGGNFYVGKGAQGDLSISPEDNGAYGSFSLSYLFKNSFGIIASANFTEFKVNEEFYNNYESLNLDYYVLSPTNCNCKLYTIRAGLMYTKKFKKFEIVPQIVAGTYFNFDPPEPGILFKENGSNLTKSITYRVREFNNKENISAILQLKYNFIPWWGFNVSGEYYYFKPSILYEIETMELLEVTNKEQYNQKLNLSWLGFSVGMHFNFLK